MFQTNKGVMLRLFDLYQYDGAGGATYLPSVSLLSEAGLPKWAVEVCPQNKEAHNTHLHPVDFSSPNDWKIELYII